MSAADPTTSFLQEDADELAFLRAGEAEKELCTHLTAAMKVAQLHSLDNVVTKEALDAFREALNSFLERSDKAEVLLAEKRVYVNGRLVRGAKVGRSFVDELVDFFLRMGMGGMVFAGKWDHEAVRQLLEHSKEIGRQGTPETRVGLMTRALKGLRPPAKVHVMTPAQAQAYVKEEEEGYASERERAAYLFARLLALGEAGFEAVAQRRAPEVHGRHLRQTFMKFVERLEHPVFEARLLGMTALPPLQDVPLASHAANVSVLAACCGRLLGLSRGALADLAFAALHHDLGRVGHEYEIGADGMSEDRTSGERHLLTGMAACLRGRSYGNAGLLRLIVGQEHHRDSDGYPEAAMLREAHPFSRIVGVADAFDRLQNGSAFRPPMTPKQALDTILADPERHRPEYAELLRDVLGTHPRGTVLRLWDGGVGVVVDGGARRGHHPIVRRLLNADQSPNEEHALLELADPGAFSKEIDPNELFIDWRGVVVE